MTRFWPDAHALVTGAGTGIGAATAIALAIRKRFKYRTIRGGS